MCLCLWYKQWVLTFAVSLCSFLLVCFFWGGWRCVFVVSQVTNTGGAEYRRWERGIDRALDDMENKRYCNY